MASLRTRLGQAYTRHFGPRRIGMRASLVVAFLAVVLATRFQALVPTYQAILRAGELYVAECEQRQLERENERLRAILAYLRTPAGQELAARSKVAAVKPGERLIIVEEGAPPEPVRRLTVSERIRVRLERTGDQLVAAGHVAAYVARALAGRVDAPTSEKPPPQATTSQVPGKPE